MTVVPKKPAPALPPTQDQPAPDPASDDTIVEETEEEQEDFEKFRVMSSLPKFELKLFKEEPRLMVTDEASKSLDKCGGFSLASVQLVSMDLKVHVSSRSEVEVQATMRDIAFCDLREESKKKNTGYVRVTLGMSGFCPGILRVRFFL